MEHGDVEPAFGYRIDYRGRSVALSGDTLPSENLIRFASGVDLLIHEVRMGDTPTRLHTTPEQAGEIFAKEKPRLAVYSHTPTPPDRAPELLAATGRTYPGSATVGEDLMTIRVGDQILVERPGP